MMSQDLQRIDPSRLPTTTIDAMQDYARQSKASNTWRNYKTQWRQFTDWCNARGPDPMPADPGDVAAYIAERAQGGAAVASINFMLAAIANAHQVAGHAFNRKHPLVATVMQGISRAHAQPQAQAAPITGEKLGQILDTCGANPMDMRDAALLSLMRIISKGGIEGTRAQSKKTSKRRKK
jgi:site-specific recombinase XerD